MIDSTDCQHVSRIRFPVNPFCGAVKARIPAVQPCFKCECWNAKKGRWIEILTFHSHPDEFECQEIRGKCYCLPIFYELNWFGVWPSSPRCSARVLTSQLVNYYARRRALVSHVWRRLSDPPTRKSKTANQGGIKLQQIASSTGRPVRRIPIRFHNDQQVERSVFR